MAKSKNIKKTKDAVLAKLNIKKIVIIAVIAAAVVYFGYTLITQQITINKNAKEIEELQQQIDDAKTESEKLQAQLDNLNDPQYIEKLAREKLGLVRPNERVFIDANKSEDNNGK